MDYHRDYDNTDVVSPWLSFYPSLMKHNSSNYYVNNLSKKRLGNLNATFMMRTPEVFLIAAEADIYVNGGANPLPDSPGMTAGMVLPHVCHLQSIDRHQDL